MLDGRKKWTALIISIAGAVILAFIVPEKQEGWLQAIQVLAPLLVGIIYEIVQGIQDSKKEEVKILGMKLTMASPRADSAAGGELSVEQFHKDVLERAKRSYKEVNDATVYYSGQARGAEIRIASDDSLRLYWEYISELAQAAYLWGQKEIEKHGPCGTKFTDVFGLRRSAASTLAAAVNVARLLDRGIDWRSKMEPEYQTYWRVGIFAGEMLGPKMKGKEKSDA